MSKRLSMAEAIARYVPDGTSVALGLALESLIPFAAGHEIIRQRRRDLTLIGPISDILFDQLIGAGCVSTIQAAWVGNVSEGLGHCYRRAAEQSHPRAITIEEYSNHTIALALLAGSIGAPYIPTQTLLGSDIPRQNPHLRVTSSPLDDIPTLLVPALRPDVTIVHVQRSDEEGNAHAWGNLGICASAFLAAHDVIVVAEELVSRATILSDPNRMLGPSYKVRAVVHEPGGAHPSPVQGHTNRDHAFYHEYHQHTRSPKGFQQWLTRWILNMPNRATYLAHLGEDRVRALRLKEHHYAAPVDYGY